MLVSIMMVRSQDGMRSYSTRYFRSLAMECDRDHVILRLVAENSGGARIVLKECNTYDIVGAEAYIRRQFEIIEEAMNDGKKQRSVYEEGCA